MHEQKMFFFYFIHAERDRCGKIREMRAGGPGSTCERCGKAMRAGTCGKSLRVHAFRDAGDADGACDASDARGL